MSCAYVSLSIKNKNDMKWYNNLKKQYSDDSKKITDTLNTALSIGIMSLQLADVSFNVDYDRNLTDMKDGLITKMDSIEDISKMQSNMMLPFIEKLDNLTTNLTNITKTPALKGKIAENILKGDLDHYLKYFFPKSIINNVAQKSHESDIQVSLGNCNTNILIESKFYNSLVDKSQIEKLYSDIENTGADAAIFISLSSPIVSKKDLFQYEFKNIGSKENVLIVYLSDCIKSIPENQDVSSVLLMSLLFIESILKLQNSKNNDSLSGFYDTDTNSEHDIHEMISLVSNHLSDLSYTITDLSNIKYNVVQARNTFNTHLDNLYKNVFDAELRLRNNMSIVSSYFDSKFGEYSEIQKLFEISKSSINEQLLLDFIRDSKKDSKKYTDYQLLFDIILDINNKNGDDDLTTTIYKNELVFFSMKNNNAKIAETYSTKKRVDIKFELNKLIGQDITINFGNEVINNNKITIVANSGNNILIQNRFISYL
jgi:hypothetical protein